MPHLGIIYDEEGWAFHNRALALRKYASPDFKVSIARLGRNSDPITALGFDPLDLVFVLPRSRVDLIRQALRELGWSSKLVVSSSSGWPRGLFSFPALVSGSDGVIVNNREYWEKTGRLPRTYLVANGVDLDVFKVKTPPESRKPKVLWTGSRLHRELKGYDGLMLPLQKELERIGIECELLLVDSYGEDKLSPQEMADWYNTGTILVCASASEGTPNPALEAAACGCTVVSTRVGNMPDLIRSGVNGYLVEPEVKSLLGAIQAANENYLKLSGQLQQDIQRWGWAERSEQYFALFRNLLAANGPPRRRRIDLRPDLSKTVTVFVSTVGAQSFESCLRHLRWQNCKFTLKVIDHVAPMSAAFQRMLDDCATPYFVQVDEDMMLHPDAVRTLYQQISEADPKIAIVAAHLYDFHLERPIYGVKIFRHEIVRAYPFQDVESCEKAQIESLKRDGYMVMKMGQPSAATGNGRDSSPATLGLHGTHWTPLSIYERYATLERKRRREPDKMAWFGAYPPLFLKRFLDDPSEINFFALMGAVAGVLAPRDRNGREKDYRTYEDLPGFHVLRSFYNEVSAGKPQVPLKEGTRINRPSIKNGVDHGDNLPLPHDSEQRADS